MPFLLHSLQSTTLLKRGLMTAALLGLSLLPVEAFATANLTELRYDADRRLLLLTLSEPTTGTVYSLNLQDRQRVLVDIQDARAESNWKQPNSLMQTLASQWPQLKNASLTAFSADKPMLRLSLDLPVGTSGQRPQLVMRGNVLEVTVFPDKLQAREPLAGKVPPNSKAVPATNTVKPAASPQPTKVYTLDSANAEQYGDSPNSPKRDFELLKASYQKLQQENVHLQSRLAEMEAKASTASPEKAAAPTANQTGASHSSSSEASLRKSIAALQKQLTEQKQKTAEAVAQVDSMTEVLATRDREFVELKRQMASRSTASPAGQPSGSDAELQSLKSEVIRLKAENLRLQSQPNSGSTANSGDVSTAALEKRLQEAGRQLSEAFNTINEQNRRISSLKEKVEQAEANVDANARSQITDLKARLDEKEHLIASLNARLGQSAPASAKSPVTAANGSSADALRAQLAKAEQRIRELEARPSAVTLDNGSSPATGSPANSPDNRVDQGLALLRANKPAEAKAMFEAALAQDARNMRAKVALADWHISKNQPSEAIQLLSPEVDAPGATLALYNSLGKAYMMADQMEQAGKTFSKGFSIDLLTNLATSLKRQGKNSQAEQVLRSALALQPEDPLLWFNLGNLYNSMQQMEPARDAYLKAVSLKSDFAQAQYNLGLICAQTGQNTEAIAALERYLVLEKQSPNRKAVQEYINRLKKGQTKS